MVIIVLTLSPHGVIITYILEETGCYRTAFPPATLISLLVSYVYGETIFSRDGRVPS